MKSLSKLVSKKCSKSISNTIFRINLVTLLIAFYSINYLKCFIRGLNKEL